MQFRMIESFLFIIIFLPAQKFLLQNCQNEQKVSENLYTLLKNRHRNSLFQINEHRHRQNHDNHHIPEIGISGYGWKPASLCSLIDNPHTVRALWILPETDTESNHLHRYVVHHQGK